MNKADIQANIISQLSILLGCNTEDICEDTVLASLGMDSMRLVELFIFIEKEYGLELMSTSVQREDLETPQALASAIMRNL